MLCEETADVATKKHGDRFDAMRDDASSRTDDAELSEKNGKSPIEDSPKNSVIIPKECLGNATKVSRSYAVYIRNSNRLHRPVS